LSHDDAKIVYVAGWTLGGPKAEGCVSLIPKSLQKGGLAQINQGVTLSL